MTEDEIILTSLLNCRRIDLYTQRPSISDGQRQAYETIRQRRAQGEPLQYILGEWEFLGLKLKVCPGVLIPRPETELLVEGLLARAKQGPEAQFKILDLGTGSGNIAVGLAKNLPQAKITTVEIDEQAVRVARENAQEHEVAGRIQFMHQDMRDFLAQAKESEFDFIISNPPYICSDEIANLSAEVRQEPRRAQDGGRDGLDYLRLIIEQGRMALKPGGWMYLEIGDGQRTALENIFRLYPEYHQVHFIQDYVATDRIAVAQKHF